MRLKVLLVDDEPNIIKILRKVIEDNLSFEVVGDCGNMADAIIQFNAKKPDVVFMDIEINSGSGIDCAKVIRELNPDVKIIFATAHSEYMSNAFEIYAFDYLVKPFNIDRIRQTLERIENSYNKNYTIVGKLLIKGRENVTFVDVSDIVMVERANNNTYIYTKDGENYVTSAAIGDIEEKICGEELIRSHKSYIINISMIKKIEPYGRWTYVVFFKGIEKDALITKEKYEQIKNLYE